MAFTICGIVSGTKLGFHVSNKLPCMSAPDIKGTLLKNVNTVTEGFLISGGTKSQLETYYVTNMLTVFLGSSSDPAVPW